jgi:ABC-type multidrug transport system ATPase subunit
MGSVIEVDNLRKRYGSQVAVADVSFQVRQREIFGLLGRNGAGKTTTVECLQGLRRADGGRVRVLSLDPQRHTQQLRRRIGCQLQEAALPDRLKVWEALDLQLTDQALRGAGGDERLPFRPVGRGAVCPSSEELTARSLGAAWRV